MTLVTFVSYWPLRAYIGKQQPRQGDLDFIGVITCLPLEIYHDMDGCPRDRPYIAMAAGVESAHHSTGLINAKNLGDFESNRYPTSRLSTSNCYQARIWVTSMASFPVLDTELPSPFMIAEYIENILDWYLETSARRYWLYTTLFFLSSLRISMIIMGFVTCAYNGFISRWWWH